MRGAQTGAPTTEGICHHGIVAYSVVAYGLSWAWLAPMVFAGARRAGACERLRRGDRLAWPPLCVNLD